jgi:hypothetical protein
MDWALIGYISGGIATLATIATFISHQLKPKFRAAAQFWAHLVGVEENVITGQERVPGLFEVIRDLKAQGVRTEERMEERLDQQDGVLAAQDGVLETIRHEVEFNNGSSVKDATLRLEKGLTEHGTKLEALATQLNEHLKPVTVTPVTTVNVHTQEHPA